MPILQTVRAMLALTPLPKGHVSMTPARRLPHYRRAVGLVAALLMTSFMVLGSAGVAEASVAAPSVSPNPVAPGGSITVSGSGCLRTNTTVWFTRGVDVAVLDSHGTVVASGGAGQDGDGTLAANGTWSATIAIPANTAVGTYSLASDCDQYDESFNYPAVPLTIGTASSGGNGGGSTATGTGGTHLSLGSSSTSVGGSVTLSASGFVAGEKVTVTLHSTPVQLAVLTANTQGAISGSVTIPSNTVVGAHQIVLLGQTSGRTVTTALQIAAASSDLATTGSPDRALAIGAGLLLLVGLTLLVTARVRRLSLVPAGLHAK